MSARPAEPWPDGRPVAGRAGESIGDPLARGLLVLTFSTGLVDAVSSLGLGRVFTANMTGNIVLLGFGVAGSGGLPVVAPLVSLGHSSSVRPWAVRWRGASVIATRSTSPARSGSRPRWC
jgi:hypothetical protein